MIFLFLAAATVEQLNNANENITHIGIGGIFALMVIREVFGFIKSRKVESVNGNAPVSKMEFEKHKGMVQYKDNCFEIVKRMDGRFDNVDSQLHEVKTLIKNGS